LWWGFGNGGSAKRKSRRSVAKAKFDFSSLQAAIERGVQLCEEQRGHSWERLVRERYRRCSFCGALEVVVDPDRRTLDVK